MIGRPPKNALGDSWRSTGFLSMGPIDEGTLRKCKSITQCFRDVFTYNGGKVM